MQWLANLVKASLWLCFLVVLGEICQTESTPCLLVLLTSNRNRDHPPKRCIMLTRLTVLVELGGYGFCGGFGLWARVGGRQGIQMNLVGMVTLRT
eukprot:6143218-Amphidinium_carterae.1